MAISPWFWYPAALLTHPFQGGGFTARMTESRIGSGCPGNPRIPVSPRERRTPRPVILFHAAPGEANVIGERSLAWTIHPLPLRTACVLPWKLTFTFMLNPEDQPIINYPVCSKPRSMEKSLNRAVLAMWPSWSCSAACGGARTRKVQAWRMPSLSTTNLPSNPVGCRMRVRVPLC